MSKNNNPFLRNNKNISNQIIPGINLGNNNNGGGILDQFTSADDTLRAIKNILNTQNQLLHNQTQLLAALLQKDMTIVLPSGGSLNVNLERDVYTTERREWFSTNFNNVDKFIIDEYFTGQIAELLFLNLTSGTDNDQFSIKIIADEKVIYDYSYTKANEYSSVETDMTADTVTITINGTDYDFYCMQFQDINFYNHIQVLVYDNSVTTFKRVYMKIHKRLTEKQQIEQIIK